MQVTEQAIDLLYEKYEVEYLFRQESSGAWLHEE